VQPNNQTGGKPNEKQKNPDVAAGRGDLRHQRGRVQNRGAGSGSVSVADERPGQADPHLLRHAVCDRQFDPALLQPDRGSQQDRPGHVYQPVLLGYVTEFTYGFLQTVIVNPSMPVRALCLIVGIVVICFGSALYMTADLGVSTYDAIAIALSGKWKIARFQYCRIATDLVCVISGVVLFLMAGGTVGQIPTIAGVGTIVTAFFMGPLIEYFNKTVARPMLAKEK